MDTALYENLIRLVESVPEPRRAQGLMYPVQELLLLVLLATICGATDLVGVCTWANARKDWLSSFLPLEHGIPSHDTLARVLSLLETNALASMLEKLTTSIAGETATTPHIAIDGKSIRGCHNADGGSKPLHLVQAWVAQHDRILGVLRVQGGENEIVAIPKLLDLLNIEGHVVTIDAIGCQTEIARQIRRQKGDYILRLKDNQMTLHTKVAEFFEDALAEGTDRLPGDEQTNGEHGRVEVRRLWMYTLDPKRDKWMRNDSNRLFPGLRHILRIESVRYEAKSGKETVEHRHYLSSLDADAAKHNALIREHWGIENKSHWVLDVAMREDESRLQNIHTAMSLAVIRRVALAKLKSEKSAKVGIKNKMLRCASDTDYLLRVLSS